MRGDTTPAEATIVIEMELFSDHPERRGSMVFESMTLDSVTGFQRDAEAWLKDRSELDGDVYDLADWPSIYTTFKNWGA